MSQDNVQQLPRKGFRQEKAPTKGAIQKENETLSQQLLGKVKSLEMQIQMIGNMLGQTMGSVRSLAPEVDMLTVLEASTVSYRSAQKGDLVMIDYAGVLLDDNGNPELDSDGLEKYFQGGSGLKFVVKGLGSGTLLPEFEAAIEFKNVGDEFDVDVTFPEKYPEKSIAGRKARFSIVVHRINQPLNTSSVEKKIRDNELKKAELAKKKAEAKQAEATESKEEATV